MQSNNDSFQEGLPVATSTPVSNQERCRILEQRLAEKDQQLRLLQERYRILEQRREEEAQHHNVLQERYRILEQRLAQEQREKQRLQKRCSELQGVAGIARSIAALPAISGLSDSDDGGSSEPGGAVARVDETEGDEQCKKDQQKNGSNSSDEEELDGTEKMADEPEPEPTEDEATDSSQPPRA
ncbi:uncharacterized protein LOC126576686 [Anopheles aquasalis]|uniref:uncharacterized protein LOC126576686 n=1 Tax=Anopheles aquasalis TaxID=42839 RepID=UPI00215A30D9|nr:uncharacterized protein LOC126576686 [Anopheles aquasalis]